jgi:hypothetical protein
MGNPPPVAVIVPSLMQDLFSRHFLSLLLAWYLSEACRRNLVRRFAELALHGRNSFVQHGCLVQHPHCLLDPSQSPRCSRLLRWRKDSHLNLNCRVRSQRYLPLLVEEVLNCAVAHDAVALVDAVVACGFAVYGKDRSWPVDRSGSQAEACLR